jgi:hypothetical protein
MSPCFINQAICYEDACGSGIIAPSFLISELDGGERSGFTNLSFDTGGKMDGKLGGTQGPVRVLSAVGNRTPSVHPVARNYTDSLM